MDPIAHSLVGAALARSGLEKRSPYAAIALVIGANLPDVDGVTYFVGGDLGLYFRRGWTHGLPAIAIWPFVLAGALFLLGRGRARFGTLVWLSLLAVATHPALDWLNNYGMRWLMPLDGRWFYGDALFIIDPWIWLSLGGAVFLATSQGWLPLISWILGAAALSFVALAVVPGLLLWKLIFVAGLLAFAMLRAKRVPRSPAGCEKLTRGAIAFTSVYVLSMVALSAAAHRWTLRELHARGFTVESLMVGPAPISPFTRDVVFSTSSEHRHGTLSIGSRMGLAVLPDSFPRNMDSPLVARALHEPAVRGFATWARFPWAEIEQEQNGFRVTLRDARYARSRNSSGFGTAVVFLRN
jgi:inner membrane protein